MKIVLVSPFNIANYGAMLQGWALRTVLERMGHDVKHLNVPWLWHGVRSWWRILRSKSVKAVIGKIRINRMMRHYYSWIVGGAMTRPYKSLKALRQLPPDADCYIAGSDQVWGMPNLKSRRIADVVLLNFGDKSIERLAYAVSIGTAHWSQNEVDIARNRFLRVKRFVAFSSREQSGCRLVEEATGRPCSWVPDPTLLLRQEDYLALINESISTVGRGTHVFTYILGFDSTHDHCPEMIDDIMGLIKAQDSSIEDVHSVSIPADLKTWLTEIASSRYVITNSFHGLCFSLLFHRPFVVVGFCGKDAWRNERVLCLLGLLGLMDRFYTTFDEGVLRKVLASELDWKKVDYDIDRHRERGYEFLAENLIEV